MDFSNEITYSDFENRFKERQLIGSGGFAQVFKVFDHANSRYVALKMAPVRPDWKKFTLRNEVALVNKLPRHRNIARYDACYRFNTGITGEMDFAILHFYEYGNLEQFLVNQELTDVDKKLIIQGLLDGLIFLHKHNVIHRDLKAQNVLINREAGVWTPKITDFGLSRQVMEQSTLTNSAIGLSVNYAAPEQILNRKIYKNVDIWSLGVLIYRIIADELPFKSKTGGDDKSANSRHEITKKIVKAELPHRINEIEQPYQQMIRRCLVLDPLVRAQSAIEINSIFHNGEDPQQTSFTNTITTSLETDISDPDVSVTGYEEVPENSTIPIQPTPKPKAKKSYPSLPDDDYYIPKANVTQVIGKKKNQNPYQRDTGNEGPPSEERRADSEHQQTPPPKKKKKHLGLILGSLILLAAIAGGLWWTHHNQVWPFDKSSATSTEISPDNDFVQQKFYVEIEESIEENKSNILELKAIEEDLLKETHQLENRINYRPYFLLC